jgi:hypothetical protein
MRRRFAGMNRDASLGSSPSGLPDLLLHRAVNQCSGNSRGLFNPRVTGGQLTNGAMGNAVGLGCRSRMCWRERN